MNLCIRTTTAYGASRGETNGLDVNGVFYLQRERPTSLDNNKENKLWYICIRQRDCPKGGLMLPKIYVEKKNTPLGGIALGESTSARVECALPE